MGLAIQQQDWDISSQGVHRGHLQARLEAEAAIYQEIRPTFHQKDGSQR